MARNERGSMAVELVLLAPIFVMFMLLVVAGGRFVTVQSDIEAAARDAVRAASYQRDADSAVATARSVAAQGVADDASCAPAQLGGAFVAGATITVTLDCRVDLSGLGLIGLPGSVAIDADSSAPLDFFPEVVVRRRTVHDERGAAAIFLVMFSVVMFAAAGLVVDGGQAINARMRAADDAEQASRAGAQAIDLVTLRATGEIRLLGSEARQVAAEFLGARGYGPGQYDVTLLDSGRVQVQVRDTVDTALLSLVGIQRFRVEGLATASPCTGVDSCG